MRKYFALVALAALMAAPALANDCAAPAVLRPGSIVDVPDAEYCIAMLLPAGAHMVHIYGTAGVEIRRDPADTSGMSPEAAAAGEILALPDASGQIGFTAPYDGLLWLKLHNVMPLNDLDGHPQYPVQIGLDIMIERSPVFPAAAPPPATP